MESMGMLGGTSYYDNPNVGMQNTKMANTPSLRQRLDHAVQQAEEKVASVKRAREIFEKNPDLEELLNIMQRSHF